MADKPAAHAQAHSSKADESSAKAGALALDTIFKKTFAGLIAIIGMLAGIAVFTAPFARTGPELISITLAALAALLLAGVGLAVLYTRRAKVVTTSVGVMALVVLVALAAGAGIGYVVWHARSAPARSSATYAGGISSSSTGGAGSNSGFTAQVAWTNDGGGGGSSSTILYAFTSPHSHIHEGAYPLGQSLTVVCQVPNGRAVQVGPAYTGPNPHSIVWYQLDNSAWVPAVYVHVNRAAAVPSCR
jgi:hypothetical protein